MAVDCISTEAFAGMVSKGMTHFNEELQRKLPSETEETATRGTSTYVVRPLQTLNIRHKRQQLSRWRCSVTDSGKRGKSRNYCVTRRELLAVVMAVDNFSLYLYNQEFRLRTDHV